MKKISTLLGLTTAFVSLAAMSNAALVNGSFETPTANAVAGFTTITSLPGWTVGDGANAAPGTGNVDVVAKSLWNPFDGNQSLDLDGTRPGSISQSMATVVGQVYFVNFVYSDNALAGGTNFPTARYTLSGAGTDTQVLAHSGAQPNNMNYVPYGFLFTATSNSVTISFTSLDPALSDGGIVIDAVSIIPTPEPGTYAMLAGLVTAGGAFLLRRRVSRKK